MHRFFLVIFFLLFPCLPHPALAQEGPAQPPALEGWSVIRNEPQAVQGGEAENPAAATLDGQGYMDRAEESYSSGDYEKALADYRLALPLLADRKKSAKAHARLAFIYAAFGQPENVHAEFLESLKLDPAQELDPNLVSPKIYEVFVKAKDEVVREGTLVCNCDPAGAEVYLDDVLLGEAPVKKEHIPEGEHVLTLKKPGYETSSGGITIKKGVTLTAEDKLVEARGEIYVSTEPSGVTVLLDGRESGVTPLTLRKVTGGSHTVLLKREYLEPYEAPVTVEAGGKGRVEARLRRRLLFIAVSGDGGEDMSPGLTEVVDGLFKDMPGLKVIPMGLGTLGAWLKERGLEPGALDFIRRRKASLELEDAAVLSGLMEKAEVRLALMAGLHARDDLMDLTLTLYSTASGMGDRVTLVSRDIAGLKEEFGRFLARWAGEEKGMNAGIGARLIDRAAGGVEVLRVLPGSPAGKAGLAPGDVITGADGRKVGSKGDISALFIPEKHIRVKYVRGGREQEVDLVPAEAPVETPVISGDYLYNLALAGFRDLMDSVPDTPETKKVRGYAALNLGNVYMRMGSPDKAVKAYREADTGSSEGVCTGTAFYRLGEAYERLGQWAEAAASYRKALMLYPYATLESMEGPLVAPLARERLKELFALGLVRERWWM